MKTALITGAARRIGKAIAERLLLENYRLFLHANTSFAELEQWVSSHAEKDKIILLQRADLAREEGQNALITEANKSISSLDLLVHNASLYQPSPFSHIDREQFRTMMGINLEAPFFITQGLLAKLLVAQRPSVINIIDAMWQRPSPQFSHYAVAKAGLAILTRALANEFAPHLRVNAVAPGAIIRPAFRDDATHDRVIERTPFRRLGDARNVADAVFYLSEVADYASGEILVIDGGRSIAP